jgi:ABC-type sulfate transport system permease subunit
MTMPKLWPRLIIPDIIKYFLLNKKRLTAARRLQEFSALCVSSSNIFTWRLGLGGGSRAEVEEEQAKSFFLRLASEAVTTLLAIITRNFSAWKMQEGGSLQSINQQHHPKRGKLFTFTYRTLFIRYYAVRYYV